jgi:hypothetical protein
VCVRRRRKDLTGSLCAKGVAFGIASNIPLPGFRTYKTCGVIDVGIDLDKTSEESR